MTNTKKLEDIIQKSGYKKAYLAEKIGLTPAGFCNCLNNRAEFRASQIATLCDLLGIHDWELKEAIFFSPGGA